MGNFERLFIYGHFSSFLSFAGFSLSRLMVYVSQIAVKLLRHPEILSSLIFFDTVCMLVATRMELEFKGK